jgi:hypothetical protein
LELLTVKVFDNAIEAHLWKTKLENEGILCFLFDENVVSTHPFYANAVGGIKLMIRATDAEQAKMVLLAIGDEAIRLCPDCLSINTHPYSPTHKWKAVWFSLIEAFSGKHYQQCQECLKVFL